MHELVEAFRSTSGVAIPGQVHEIERRSTVTCDPVDVDEPRLARSPAGPRDLLAYQRVDQTRLAHIGAADECDFGQPMRHRPGARSARDELGKDVQGFRSYRSFRPQRL